jgi:hypothetical protein
VNARQKWLWALFVCVCVASVFAVIFIQDSKMKTADSHDQNATTSGSNSPAMNALTTGSKSPVYQAVGTQVINNGISEATMLAMLRDKSIAANEELSSKYPHGYVLFGLANGRIVYEPINKDFQIKGDWGSASLVIDEIGKTVSIAFGHFEIVRPAANSANIFNNCTFTFPYAQNQPMRIPINRNPNLICEVLDMERGMFLIGLQ